MVLESKQTTVAYRCPHCGAGVLSAVGMFSLAADMVKLKCTCGHSEMELVYSKDGKIRIKVPCMICPNGHSYTVSRNIFFGRDVFMLPCPISDINICFMGSTDHVKFELSRTELELLQILEDNGVDSFSALHGDENLLTDPQIAEIVMFVIHDLEAENKIYCKCNPAPAEGDAPRCHSCEDGEEPERVYDVEIVDDGIKVSCPECGCSRVIPTDGLLSAHAFLNCDALYLE
jgi:predicted RNA-binding Zn-ribbon protein involved in translation (DUF1610 family)